MCSYMINKKVQPLQGIIQCWFTHPCAASLHIVAILQQHHVQLGLRPCKPVFSPMSQAHSKRKQAPWFWMGQGVFKGSHPWRAEKKPQSKERKQWRRKCLIQSSVICPQQPSQLWIVNSQDPSTSFLISLNCEHFSINQVWSDRMRHWNGWNFGSSPPI